MDGDAFRQCEREVFDTHGLKSCVVGVQVYSDSRQIFLSGGKPRAIFVREEEIVCDIDCGVSQMECASVLTMALAQGTYVSTSPLPVRSHGSHYFSLSAPYRPSDLDRGLLFLVCVNVRQL